MVDSTERLAVAIDIARRAGDMALSFFRDIEKLTVESKGHQDLVTNADREVELFIRAELQRHFPEDGIVGEEHAATFGSSGHVWIIDPIDGTANFVRGIPVWCVVLACTLDGVTHVGVINEPSSGELFHAERGRGAFVNGRAIATTTATGLTQGSIGIGFNNRDNPAKVVALIQLILAEGGVFFRNASGALMLAYVAAGRLLGYGEQHMNSWDCMAALLMVEEAGGRVEPLDASRVVHHGTPVICGGIGVFAKVRELCVEALELAPAKR